MSALAKKQDISLEDMVKEVSQIVEKESGNVLGDNQISMVRSRLKKRLIDLGNLTPSDYQLHLQNNYREESSKLVSLLTTHHTFFFREFSHYEYIRDNLDSIVNEVKKRGDKKVRVYSAACSKGQEVYSLAMLLEKHLSSYSNIDYEIVGTDIDPESVAMGANGVYFYKEVKSIPNFYLTGNWQRGKGDIAQFARVKDHIKKKCSFSTMNLMDSNPKFNGVFDIILCRNVFIYFEQKTVADIVLKLKKYLRPKGLLITGLSESLKSLDIKMNTHAPSVYSFHNLTENESVEDVSATTSEPIVSKTTSIVPKPIRILSVDDSKSIAKLVKMIFEKDPDFEYVGHAENGLEAEEFLKNNKVDAMTLDIHMPEMDGVEYLKKNFGPNHPKVVVVSSASREDTNYAQQTLKYGASDFVEKPALNNLRERAEEIKSKIKMSFLNSEKSQISDLDQEFQNDFVIEDCTKAARFFFGSYSDLFKVEQTIKSFKGDQPPTFFILEGNEAYLDMISNEVDVTSEVLNGQNDFRSNTLYICDFATHSSVLMQKVSGRKSSICVFGLCTNKIVDFINTFDSSQLLLEDVEGISNELRSIAVDTFPWTSFAHLSTEFLGKKA